MAKFQCTVCNYEYEGSAPPTNCPSCQADSSGLIEMIGDSWVTIEPNQGTGDTTVSITAEENTSTETRTKEYYVTTSNGTNIKITITQEGIMNYIDIYLSSDSEISIDFTKSRAVYDGASYGEGGVAEFYNALKNIILNDKYPCMCWVHQSYDSSSLNSDEKYPFVSPATIVYDSINNGNIKIIFKNQYKHEICLNLNTTGSLIEYRDLGPILIRISNSATTPTVTSSGTYINGYTIGSLTDLHTTLGYICLNTSYVRFNALAYIEPAPKGILTPVSISLDQANGYDIDIVWIDKEYSNIIRKIVLHSDGTQDYKPISNNSYWIQAGSGFDPVPGTEINVSDFKVNGVDCSSSTFNDMLKADISRGVFPRVFVKVNTDYGCVLDTLESPDYQHLYGKMSYPSFNDIIILYSIDTGTLSVESAN